MAPHFESMLIDDERILTLTKYATRRGIKNLVKSDHNILVAKFSIDYKKHNYKKPRTEIFNLKNPACQELFYL